MIAVREAPWPVGEKARDLPWFFDHCDSADEVDWPFWINRTRNELSLRVLLSNGQTVIVRAKT